MEAYLAVFISALCLALLLTPLARTIGIMCGAMDIPNQRKVHDNPKPRTGGVAIFLSFLTALAIGALFGRGKVPFGPQEQFLLAGALGCFLIGLVDDLYRLSALTKLIGQIIAVSIAFYGGNRIGQLPFWAIDIPTWFSYCLTLSWFLLFINAINLIDGLDGLAAGICLFTSLLMVVISAIRGEATLVLSFAALSGSLFGFLKYNFNPSTIFMGDGGSYFLGFIISGLSIYGSAKGQVGALFMIPFVGMGIPIFDTLTTPLRRFVRGRKVFSPDNGHIHHKLIAMGLTTRRAVLTLYVLTSLLCAATIIAVNVRDEMIGFIVFIAALAMLFLYRKADNWDMTLHDASTWMRDVAHVTGISQDRRFFFDIQIRMKTSTSLEELWSNACILLDRYDIDFAELKIALPDSSPQGCPQTGTRMQWSPGDPQNKLDLCRAGLLKIELPLASKNGQNIGNVWIVKDIQNNELDHRFFMRLEQLRRSLVECLQRLNQ